VKNDLKGWGANIRGRDKKRKQELLQELSDLEEMEEASCLSRDQMLRKIQAQKDIEQIIEKEEDFW
jgi:hypothetical protein